MRTPAIDPSSDITDDRVRMRYPRLMNLYAARAREGFLTELWEDGHVHLLSCAENLLEEANMVGVTGLEKIPRDDASNSSKFENILAELRLGVSFSRLGFQARLLHDREFGEGKYTPDLWISGNGEQEGLQLLAEVMSGSCGDVDIVGPTNRALEASSLPFRVCYLLGEQLSAPGINGTKREEQQNRLSILINKLVTHLARQSRDSTGTFEFDGDRFDFGPSPTGTGFVGCGGKTARLADSSAREQRFLADISKKARKRSKLPSKLSSTPFIIAYENREPELGRHLVHSALTGQRTVFLGSPEERLHWAKANATVHDARVRGIWDSPWQPLLDAWGFGPESACRIDSPGAFLSPDATWAEHVSGVLVTHWYDPPQWFPNPFAKVTDSRLMDLGLGLARWDERIGRA